MKLAVKVENLHKSYNGTEALKGISFSVKRGEIFGLLGPNGAGKSTAINIMGGLLTMDSGSVEILGMDILKNMQKIKPQMNLISAFTSLTRCITVRENLTVYGRLYNVRNLSSRIDELLETFGISHLKNRKVRTLSTGQNARMLLCKGLLNNPKILLLDECTLGLDPDIADRTRSMIKFVQKEFRTTMIFTSHNMAEVEQLCGRIAFLYNGRILKIGTALNFARMIDDTKIELNVLGKKRLFMKICRNHGARVSFSDDVRATVEMAKRDVLPNLLRDVLKEIPAEDIEIRTPSLEDVFIKIARGEMKGKIKLEDD